MRGKKPHNLPDRYYSEELLNQRALSGVSMILTEYVCHWQLGWHHQPYYSIFIFISWRKIFEKDYMLLGVGDQPHKGIRGTEFK